VYLGTLITPVVQTETCFAPQPKCQMYSVSLVSFLGD